jgi:hypothetical protein
MATKVFYIQERNDEDPIPNPGDFSWLKNDGQMLSHMYKAISYLGLWPWLHQYVPKPTEGFMFSWCPEIHAISVEVDSDGHSGSSFAYCMRHMDMIAKKGWTEYYVTLTNLSK